MNRKFLRKTLLKQSNSRTKLKTVPEPTNSEDNLASVSTLKDLAKSVLLLTDDISKRAKFNAQHNVAFEMIGKFRSIPNTVCDCNCILSKDKIDRFHRNIGSQLLELTTQIDQIERKWMSTRLYLGEEKNKAFANVMELLKGIKEDCELKWTPEAEPVLRTIAMLRHGKVLQQIEEMIGQEKYKKFSNEKENEKSGKDSLTFWQRNVLKLLK